VTITLIGAVKISIESTELVISRTAGELIPAKSVVCIGESDGKVYKAKADSSTTMPAVGVTRETALPDETVKIYKSGIVPDVLREADFSPDDVIFVSPNTAGKVTKTPPDAVGLFVQTMGRAASSADIVLEVSTTFAEIGS
jgi:hypothetical protein